MAERALRHPATRTWRGPVAVLVCGTLILFISFGARNVFGILLEPMTTSFGWSVEEFSFAVAAQAFLWGVTTPLTASLADRYGTGRMVAIGGILYAGGMGLIATVTSPFELTLTAGLLLGLGLSATGFPIILAAVTKRVDQRRRSLFLGIGSAAGSSGQFALVPFGQYILDGFGWPAMVVVFAVLTAMILPLSAALSGSTKTHPRQRQRMGEALSEALSHRGFVLLTTAYFVCGFQVMFLATHLPNYLIESGHGPWLGAAALSIIGFANIVGTLGWGALGGLLRLKYLLCTIYLLRSLTLALFALLPVTPAGTWIFSAVIGMLWLATVPLTTGLVAHIFGVRYMATLTGIVFFSHQIGSFFGIWLGGRLFVETGSYVGIWWLAVALGLVAALLHFPINDQPLSRQTQQEPQTT